MGKDDDEEEDDDKKEQRIKNKDISELRKMRKKHDKEHRERSKKMQNNLQSAFMSKVVNANNVASNIMSKPEAREDFYKYEDMSNNGSVNGNLME